MKVCHVISGYFRNDARVFQRQCKSLHQDGIEVSILTNDGEKEEILDDILIQSCDKFFSSRLAVLLFAKYQFYSKALAVDADIFQCHSPELISLGLSLKKKGKKVIYDAHEDLPRHIIEKEWLDWLPLFLRKLLSFIVEVYLHRALKKYDAVITPHHHVHENLLKANINSTLITNFPLVRNLEDFSYADYQSRGNKICYTGTVYSYSHQEEILEAISDIDVQYKVAGYFDPIHLDSLSYYKGFSKMEFLGRIPWQNLGDFYRKMSIGIVVYDYKLNLGNRLGSFGSNKLFEYMEAGLPIICTDYILWKEVVEKYECGLTVEPRNIDQLRDAIRYLLQNKEIAYKFGKNGQKAVKEELNWSTEEKKYLGVLNEYRYRNAK